MKSLTSVFGMGTGGPSSPLPPNRRRLLISALSASCLIFTRLQGVRPVLVKIGAFLDRTQIIRALIFSDLDHLQLKKIYRMLLKQVNFTCAKPQNHVNEFVAKPHDLLVSVS